MPRQLSGVVLCLLVQGALAGTVNRPKRFLLVSSPQSGHVLSVKVGPYGGMEGETPKQLINAGLLHPYGLAMDEAHNRVIVTDPDQKKVISYDLSVVQDELTASNPRVVADQYASHWVACDAIGNVYISDEATNTIYKVPARSYYTTTVVAPEVVYDGTNLEQLSGPGGIFADNLFVYWTNKLQGAKYGSVARGPTAVGNMAPSALIQTLASNLGTAYGVCVAMNSNLYYTAQTKAIYGVKLSGGGPVEISNKLTSPRGCTWDRDGTVYIADNGANMVYAFPSNMDTLTVMQMTASAKVDGAYGVAYFSGASRGTGALAVCLSVLVALCWSL